MTVDDRKFENEGGMNDRDVEGLIDKALAQYAMDEPRPGLEGRVLAGLAAERSRRGRQWWGVLAFGTAAALALALFFLGRLDPRLIPEAPVAKLAKSPPWESTPSAKAYGEREGQKYSGRTKQAAVRPRSAGKDKSVGAARPNAPPKLEQFPAPGPLNEQERMLALYVRDFPEKAALMARAQTEVRKEDEREMAAPWPKNAREGFERQE